MIAVPPAMESFFLERSISSSRITNSSWPWVDS